MTSVDPTQPDDLAPDPKASQKGAGASKDGEDDAVKQEMNDLMRAAFRYGEGMVDLEKTRSRLEQDQAQDKSSGDR